MRYEKKSINKIKVVKGLFIYALVLVVTVAFGVSGGEQGPVEDYLSQNPGLAGADVIGSEDTLVEAERAVAGLDMPEDASIGAKIQSISFRKDWGIRDALQFLAARYQKNIVPSTKVDGLITITNLYNVTFEEALEAILGHSFEYEQRGNFIKVYTEEEYTAIKEDLERMQYRIFTLYYISAAEAKKLITPVLSKNGRVETTSAAVTEFPTGESISSVTGGGDTTALNDTIIICDYPENIEEIAEVLKQVDIRPKQVLVEATILSVTLTEDSQFGIDWSTLNGVLTQIPAVASAAGDIAKGASEYLKSAGTSQVSKSGGLTVGFAHDNVAAFIRAVETVSDVTILANPKILAVNKQLGQVYIGKKIGYQSQTTQTDTSTTQQVEFLDTGTKLSFRPYIGNDGYIRMDIHPKDSSGDLVSSLPQETSAELVTNIIVKDGQTVVIGGLFRDTIKANKTQIPVLGDLPLAGGLFRGTADQAKREEVVVLLTPHIISEPAELEGEARANDVSRKRFGAKDEMQPIGRARIAEDSYAKAVKFYLQGDNESAMQQLVVALKIRPSYLEAIRLKERIIAETSPEDVDEIERIMLDIIDRQEAPKWQRR
jgi:type IV pilus assembly protein PilQ